MATSRECAQDIIGIMLLCPARSDRAVRRARARPCMEIVHAAVPLQPTTTREGVGGGWTHMLAPPQGFTLAIAGSLAICLGRHGYLGPVGMCLSVAGAPAGRLLSVDVLGQW